MWCSVCGVCLVIGEWCGVWCVTVCGAWCVVRGVEWNGVVWCGVGVVE